MAEKKEGSKLSFLSSKVVKIGIVCAIFFIPILLFFMIPGYKASDGFKTLAEVEKYAATFDEKKISMENTNLDKPEYSAFYKSQRLGFFGARLKTLGLSSGLPWTVHSYKNLLEKAIELTKPKNYTGVFALKIATSPATKIVVWGDVQGAFHSLARDLRELVKLGVIDENLKVASPDNYLVFMGDVISRSPFIMETVSLVCRLILTNPENVFYLRGNHESNNYWNGKGLERELKLRARTLDKSAETPLEKLTNDFFDTLPALIYAGILPNETAQFVRISHEGADGESKIAEINDAKLAPFLSTKLTGKIASFNYKEIKEGVAAQPIEIKAIVKAEIKRKTYQAMDGLRLTSPENGVTAWTMLSCPTETYQKGLEYFFDAFSIIQAGAKIEDWTITLHSQDVRTLSGFKTRQHNLISGQVIGGDGAVAASTPPVAPATPVPVAAPTTQSPAAAVPQAQNQVQVTAPAVPVVAPAQLQAVQTVFPAQVSAQTATPVAAPQQQPTPPPQVSTVAVPVAQSPAPTVVATPSQTQSAPQAAPVATATPVPVVAQTPPVQTSVPAPTAAQSVATPAPTPVQQNPAVAPVAQVQVSAPVIPAVAQASQAPVAPQVQTQEVLTATPAPAQPQVVQTTPVAVAPQQTPASAVPVTTLTAAAVQPAAPQPVAQVVPAQVVVAQPAQSQTPAPVAAPQGSGEITFKPYKSE